MSKRYSEQEKLNLIEKVFGFMVKSTTPIACQKAGVPETTFTDWCRADSDLADRHARVKALYIEKLVERMMTLAKEQVRLDDRGRTDNGRVQQIRVEIDTIKWLVSRLMPKRYGDRLALVGDEEQPVAIVKVERTVIDKRKGIEESG